jgi:hypothetical protein
MSDEDNKSDASIVIGGSMNDSNEDVYTTYADSFTTTPDVIVGPDCTSYYLSDDMGTVTIGSTSATDTSWYSSNGPLSFDFGDLDSTITVGSHKLTEDRLEKLNALLDVLMEDPEWAEKINTQIAFKKLGNQNED